MKKFSIAAPTVALAALAAVFAPQAALAAPQTGAPRCEFLANAPDQHTVVRGDTLWGISGKFLEHPWCWPHVWGMNKEEIANPHWIYPGQIVYFDRVAGRLRLGKPTGDDGGAAVVKLSPQVRSQAIRPNDAITSIPSGVIEPFLAQPLIVEDETLAKSPHILATQEGRVYLGKGDKAYVRGDLQGGTDFQVYRTASPIKDPETGKVLAMESAYLGTVHLERAARADNEAHVFVVTSSKEDIGEGDRLLPLPPAAIINYAPHAPSAKVAARVASIYGGVAQAGQNQIVALNRGKEDGLDVGSVLQLMHGGRVVKDRTGDKAKIAIPEENYGSVFVFRVFNHVAYALVMQVRDAVQLGDAAVSPE